ncbi:MAG: hypothetical protein NC911_03030, partial [Candidatus Omnitrophica bacterium]|nr:hypothetical protein [Candidatus Omnitrophota bacterium]
MRKIAPILLIVLVSSVSCFSQVIPWARQAPAVKVGMPPKIDGNLDDECWKNAGAITGFRTPLNKGFTPAPDDTEVKICYDQHYLYFAWRVFEAKPEEMVVDKNIREREIFEKENDYIQIYLDPRRDQHTYYRIAITPAGCVADAYGDKTEGGWDFSTEFEIDSSSWNCQPVVSTGSFSSGWIVEMALPFSNLLLDEKSVSSEWGIRLDRYQARTKQLSTFTPHPGEDWGNTYGGIFGTLTNFQIDPVPYRTILVKPVLKFTNISGGKARAVFAAELKNATEKEDKFHLEILLWQNKKIVSRESVSLSLKKDQTGKIEMLLKKNLFDPGAINPNEGMEVKIPVGDSEEVRLDILAIDTSFPAEVSLSVKDSTGIDRWRIMKVFSLKPGVEKQEVPLLVQRFQFDGRMFRDGCDLRTRDILVPVVAEPPVVDGRLTDTVWKKAGFIPTGQWHTVARQGRGRMLSGHLLAKEQTECFFLATKEGLYIGFRCYDSDLSSLKTQAKYDGDPAVRQDDHVRFQVLGQRLLVNADGIRYDYDWKGRWKAGVSREEKAWTAEMFVPFSELPVSSSFLNKPGMALETAVVRHCARTREDSAPHFLWYWQWEHGDWSGNGNRLWGLDVIKEEVSSFAWKFSDLKIEEKVVKEGITISVDSVITNETRKERKIKVVAEITSPSGVKYRNTQDLEIPDKKEMPLNIPVSGYKKEEGVHSARMTIFEEEGTKQLATRRLEVEKVSVLTLEIRKPAYRAMLLNAMEERKIEATAIVKGEKGYLESMSLKFEVASAEGKKVLLVQEKQNVAPGDNGIYFDMKGFQPGEYEITAHLLTQQEIEIDSDRKNFRLLEITPSTVWINEEGRMFIGNEPFFAIGMYGTHPLDLEVISQAGFNTTNFHYFDRKLFDTAKELGIKIMINNPVMKEEEVVAASQHPSTLMWLLGEEISHSPERVKQYIRLSDLDPYHPVATNGSYGGKTSLYYISDVMMNHLYPYPRYPDTQEQAIDKVLNTAVRVRNMVRIARSLAPEAPGPRLAWNKKPWIIWPQYFYGGRWVSGGQGRFLTLPEMRLHCWSAVVEGASGIYFWAYWHDYTNPRMNPKLFEGVRAIAGEMRALYEFLVLPDEKHVVKVTPGMEGEFFYTVRKKEKEILVAAYYTGKEEKEFSVQVPSGVNHLYAWPSGDRIIVSGGKFNFIARKGEVYLFSTKMPPDSLVMKKMLSDPCFITPYDYRPKEENIFAGASVKSKKSYFYTDIARHALDNDPDTFWFTDEWSNTGKMGYWSLKDKEYPA